MIKQNRTKRQLTIEALGRVIWVTDQQIEALSGHDDKLAAELKAVREQIRNRQRKLEVRESA